MMGFWMQVGLCSNLKSGFGVNFDPIGHILPALENELLAIDIELPIYSQRYDPQHYRLTCSTSASDFDFDTCHDFRALMAQHSAYIAQEEARLYHRTQRIRLNLPTRQSGKSRRAIGMLALGFATGIASTINSIIMRKQLSAMQTTVDALKAENFRLKNKFVELSADVIGIAQITSDHFNALSEAINQSNANLKSVVRDVNSRLASISATSDIRFRHVNKRINVMSRKTAVSQYHIQAAERYYATMQEYLSKYENAIIDLMQGKIPPHLIPPHDLVEILGKTRESIAKTHPDFELVFHDIAHYYRQADISYTMQDDHLIILIPLLLKKQNQAPMVLYGIDTCFVPFQINKAASTPSSHTRVQIKADYIAVENKNFAEISAIQLNKCDKYNSLYLCTHYIMQVFQSRLTCASAIFWDSGPEIIAEECNFEYFHKILAPPCVLESDSHVLLTNLGNDWKFRCSSQNLPIRIEGSNFAVLPISTFCECALVGDTYFLPQRLSGCSHKPSVIQVLYPINAAVMTVFDSILPEEEVLSNLSILYDAPQEIHIPSLNIEATQISEDVLVDDHLDKEIDLKRVAEAIKSRTRMYLDREEKQQHKNKIENWFVDFDNIAIACTFILSLLGTIAFIMGMIICFKNHRIAAMFGFLMAQPPPVEAYLVDDIVSFRGVILERTYQLLLVLLVFIVYKFIKFIRNKMFLIKYTAPSGAINRPGLSTHLLIEIGNARVGLRRVYLCTLSTSVASLNIVGTPLISDFQLHLATLGMYAVMTITWPEDMFAIFCDDIQMKLPKIAYISTWNYFKINEIMQRNFIVRIIAHYDGLSYLLSQDSSFRTPPTLLTSVDNLIQGNASI